MGNVIENGKHINNQPICNKCKNHIDGVKCKAFEVIPDAILLDNRKHSKPLKNQGNKVIFEENL